MNVLFLDRDGVVNRDFGHVGQLSRFQYTDQFFENLALIANRRIPIVIVTNQAGIAKSLFSLDDHKRIEEQVRQDFAEHGALLLDYFFCPHHPEASNLAYRCLCACRKPQPGLLQLAQSRYAIDMSSSALIGDKPSDILAGLAANVCKNILVETDNSLQIRDALANVSHFLDGGNLS